MEQKQKIIKCFNSAAYTYDSAADVQQIVAKELARQFSGLPAKNILEIGCGTGLLSEYIVQLFPNSSVLLTDIAPAMVEVCRQRFASYTNVNSACMDGETLPTASQFDLIVSSMTLHWFVDIKKSLSHILTQLAPGGKLIFSLLGENSLSEWRQACQVCSVSVPTPLFPAHDLVQEIIPEQFVKTDSFRYYYKNCHDFLSSLKSLGAYATHEHHIPLSSGALRRVMRYVDKNSDLGTSITYEIIYGCYQKA